jgi:hypothetical protein
MGNPTVLPMKTAAFKFVGVTIVAIGLFFSGCTKKSTPLDQSPASNQLKHFVAEKKAQATVAAAAEGKEMLPCSVWFFSPSFPSVQVP